MQERNAKDEEERPLTARSVVASTLLGLDPPRLPGRILVRTGELFGITEGTTRVALSRMLGAGELETDGADYALAGPLLARHARQAVSRHPRLREWRGRWTVAVVVAERRPAPERIALRDAMQSHRMAELREGVWTRPDNLPVHPTPATEGQCRWMNGTWDDEDGPEFAARLWDLHGLAERARRVAVRVDGVSAGLEAGDEGALPTAFVALAAALRVLQADPLLPPELLPPGWPLDHVRDRYDEVQASYEVALRTWFRSQP